MKEWHVEHLERIKRPEDLVEELEHWQNNGWVIFQILARPDYRTHYWLVMHRDPSPE